MKLDFHVHLTPPELSRDYKAIYEKEPYWALLAESPINRFADGNMGSFFQNTYFPDFLL